MTEHQVLDHGYIKLVESWGSDARIIEAARMSTDGAFRGWGPKHEPGCSWLLPLDGKCRECDCKPKAGDERLLGHLYRNKHSTPFEMAGMIIEVQAPIFVFREWQRHRTQSYNEMSARYTPLPDLNYVPTVERLLLNSKTNKQAGTVAGAEALSDNTAKWFQSELRIHYRNQENLYQSALKFGVPKELARVHLPVGRYSRMRASANLRNWLAFLTLRQDQNAQWEIRQYADVVGAFIEEIFPRTWQLFVEGRGSEE